MMLQGFDSLSLPKHKPQCLRITLVISSLQAGGAERVMSRLATFWSETDRSICLITIRPPQNDFYLVPESVKRKSLRQVTNPGGELRKLLTKLQCTIKLRREIYASRPDVVISFVDTLNILVLLGCRKRTFPIIVSERTDPRHYKIHSFWKFLRRCLYPTADAVVVQTESVRAWAESFIPTNQVRVIPNPIASPAHTAAALGPLRNTTAPKVVIALGRLHPLKGFDRLVRAFARCAAHHPDWILRIIGEGDQRPDLERIVQEHDLQNRVFLPGKIPEPDHELLRADIFVLSSAFEGFPNALCEAMACGLPVIATDCPSGPREIIRENIDGVFVPVGDEVALANALATLMSDEKKRRTMGRRAAEITQRFGVARVMQQWEDLIAQCGKTYQNTPKPH